MVSDVLALFLESTSLTTERAYYLQQVTLFDVGLAIGWSVPKQTVACTQDVHVDTGVDHAPFN